MKKAVIRHFNTAVMALVLLAAPAGAEETYYVELGHDITRAEATAQWNALAAKHKALLSGLTLYPKAVIRSGAAVGARIQAGPIPTKARAQRICHRLFISDVPCFVIEGLSDAPPTEVMNLSEKAAGQVAREPWETPGEINAPPPVWESHTLPWLAPAPPRQAKVQVAEAIRVPLTETSYPPRPGQIAAADLPQTPFSERKPFPGNPASPDNDEEWLTLGTFPNDDIALVFWEEARAALPKRAKGLRARMQRPLLAGRSQAGASLAIGPFAGSEQAYEFCQAIQARERGLHCGFGENAAAPLAPAATPLLASAAGESRQYWVQLLSAPSQAEASRQWESLRAGNADLLGGLGGNVSASAADPNAYVVRVGPISGNTEAIRLCAALQGRGADCRVLLYSLGI